MTFEKDTFIDWAFSAFWLAKRDKSLLKYLYYIIGVICLPIGLCVGLLAGTNIKGKEEK